MNNPEIIICDCDHKDVNVEKKTFEKAGMDFRWLHCKSEKEVIEQCRGAVVFLDQYAPMNETVFKAVPTLKLIVRYGVGVDNVDLHAATKYGIQVCNVPDYGTNEVADHALTLMLCLIRKACLMCNLTKSGVWDYQRSIPVHRISDLTVGIIGVGRIGSAFAKRVHALGCKVIGYDPDCKKPGRVFPDYVEFVGKDQLIERSDVISLHCSLTSESKNIIGENEFCKMKKGTYVINVARGGLIDEAALDQALEKGQIGGAALDVVKKEPLDKASPLFRHPNILITPHMAWYSEESAEELNRKCAEEAVRFMRNEKVHYPVNKI